MAKSVRLPSLRLVFMAALAAPLAGGLIVVGAGLGKGAHELFARVSEDQHRQVGRRISAELLPVLDRPHQLNLANAELLRVTGALPDATVREHLWRQLRRAPEVGYVQVGYAVDGGFVGVERLDDGRFHAEVSDAGRTGKEVVELDAAGRPGVRVGWVPGYDARTRPWYRAAMTSDGPTWSPIYPFSSDAAPRLGITAVLALGGDGTTPQGVVGADLVLSQLSRILDPDWLGEGVRAALVERDGQLVASSAGTPFRVVDGRPTRIRGDEVADPILAAAMAEATRVAAVEVETTWWTTDPPALAWAAPLRDGRGLDWVIVVAVPEEQLVGPLRAELAWAASVGLGLMGAAAAAGVALASWLVRPVHDLSSAAEALARGDFGHPLPNPGGTAEIASLVSGFQVMRVRLEATLADAQAARRAAEESSRAKSTFFAGVSHELRTPLNAILGYTELLLDEVGDDAVRHDLEKVRRSAAGLLELINDLLDLARLESGHVEITLVSFPVADLVHDVADSLLPLVEVQGNRLVVEVAPDVGTLTSDRGRLRQILVNLLGNAAKFTQEGVVTLGARGEGDRVVFTVQDTGIGMSPELLPKIFLAFERLPGAEAREGTGLGMAIVATLVEALGADIEVQSELGKGSWFTVRVGRRLAPRP